MNINPLVYRRLQQAAHDQEVVFYGEIAALLGLDLDLDKDRAEMGRVLGAISEHEDSIGNPLLSVIVVNKDSFQPSRGFFELARYLKRLEGDTPNEETALFVSELKAAFAYWSGQTIDE